MKKQKFTETQIIKALKEYEAGKSALDICREKGVHRATFYAWNKKYSGMEGHDIKKLKDL